MKTIIDAVNELRGDLEGGEYTNSSFSGYEFICIDGVHWALSNDRIDSICSIKEFNAMVAEMSEGFEECRREYEMDKTVTVDGMVYELNELYLMHNGSESSQQLHELCEISESGNFIDENGSHWGFAVNTIKLGTITQAPVELINGKAYQFENECGICYGEYSKDSNRFYSGGSYYRAKGVKNIIPLVPEVK